MKSLAVGLAVASAFAFMTPELAPVKSGVYTPTGHTIHGRETVLKGSTAYFEDFQVDLVTIHPGDTASLKEKLDDMEELVIVKEGTLKVTINDNGKSVGPGSVAFVLPGDEHIYENASKKNVSYYLFKFKSNSTTDNQRGLHNGGSFIMDWEDVTLKPTDKGSLRSFFNRPTAACSKFEMHVTSLNEGLASHAPHTHAEEEIVLMLKGKARMNIDNKYHDVTPGAIIFLASGVPHALQNTGKGAAEYFAFQWR